MQEIPGRALALPGGITTMMGLSTFTLPTVWSEMRRPTCSIATMATAISPMLPSEQALQTPDRLSGQPLGITIKMATWTCML